MAFSSNHYKYNYISIDSSGLFEEGIGIKRTSKRNNLAATAKTCNSICSWPGYPLQLQGYFSNPSVVA